MGTETQFRTFQTVRYYEESLARHGQWLRWAKSTICPCLSEETAQADPSCSLCEGRGKLYRAPDELRVMQEVTKHNSYGKVYTKYTPVSDPVVWRKNVQLTLAASQPSDSSYIQLDPPYPKSHERVKTDYTYTPLIEVADEDSEVYGTNTLRTIATQFYDKGKKFEGSVAEVTKVHNVDRDEDYTVTDFAKEFIYLDDMGTWQSGDVLQVLYKYVKPFDFLLVGVSQKMRYERAYVIESADALLVTPFFCRIAPNDLMTALSIEQVATVVIKPRVGNDVVRNYYDISRLIYVVDAYGQEYVVGTNVELYGRNQLKWLTTKPTVKYSAQFYYHPTFAALMNLPSTRSGENKAFVNRVNLIQYDKTDEVEW